MLNKVFFIASGMEFTRKRETTYSYKNLYLNYGLLSIATQIKYHGIDAVQIQGNFDSAIETVGKCKEIGISETIHPIFVSIPSFFALSWAKKFISELSREFPNLQFIVGGRWVIDGHPELLKAQIPEATLIIDGLGENKVLYELHKRNPNLFIKGVSEFSFDCQYADFTILNDRNLYQPNIEVSRGCGRGCHFCQERDEKISQLKAPKKIFAELHETIIEDNLPKAMTPYFEASNFIPTAKWVSDFKIELEKYGKPLRWRAETRVDSFNSNLLEPLSQCGFSVIDIGLESASHDQLNRMEKTTNPSQYLNKASALLRRAKEFGIKAKVNVLFYAGETQATINETLDWLERHRECIHGLSVGPVTVFGWPTQVTNYLEKLAAYGAVPISKQDIIGVTKLNLSKTLSFEESEAISFDICKSFMDDKSYFDLKSFSYFPRNYSWEKFSADANANIECNPFSISSNVAK